jgi:hypothetical protein
MKLVTQYVIFSLLLSPSFYLFSYPGHKQSYWSNDFYIRSITFRYFHYLVLRISANKSSDKKRYNPNKKHL